jgi:hypothetical protein
MSEFKKIMGVINGSSAPRQMMTLLELGTGDRVSSHYEKYAPKSRIIISILGSDSEIVESRTETLPTEAAKSTAKESQRSTVKDSFSILIEALLPDEVYHPIAEFKHEGVGTSELQIDDFPANWRLSVMTKSKHSYSVFGY